MKKKILIIVSIIIILLLIFMIVFYKNHIIYRKFDITDSVNKLNKNKSYFEYNFKKVFYYKPIKGSLNIIEAEVIVKNKETKKQLKIYYNIGFYFKDYYGDDDIFLGNPKKTQKSLELFNYSFFKKNIHYRDVDRRFEDITKDKAILSILRYTNWLDKGGYDKFIDFFGKDMVGRWNIEDNIDDMPLIIIER